MFFITTLNGVISGLHAGDIDVDFFGTPYYGHDRQSVPSIDGLQVLDPLVFYTPDGQRKPDTQLIKDGLLPMPQGYVWDGDALRAMTADERVIAGLDEPQPGFIVVNGNIIEMSIPEKVEAGLVSQEDYEQQLSDENIQELQRRLANLQTPDVLAQAEVDEEYAAERKIKLIELLAVKKQLGWPFEVNWPN
jgi:hypothetical protein